MLFISEQLYAWGTTGHRVVGEVAQQHLSKKTKKKLAVLLQNQTLADVSNWMDDIKSDKSYNHMYDWHWVTIPNGKSYEESEKSEKGDIVATIERCISELKKGGLPQEQEVMNIKILAHLIGDIHQPFHVGTGEDKGGNDVKVKWFGKNSNLHRVWDSEMIDSKKYSYTELANKINRYDKATIQQLQNSKPRDWAKEAMALREQIYKTGNVERMGYRYMYDNYSTVERQLGWAGIRLAGVLNSIYDK